MKQPPIDPQQFRPTEADTRLLYWMLKALSFSYRGQRLVERYGPELIPDVCAEIRRRKLKLTSYQEHCLMRLDPPRCFCGEAGLYIVSLKTYCEEHKHQGKRQREVAMSAKERASHFIEYRRKRKDYRDLGVQNFSGGVAHQRQTGKGRGTI